MTRDLPRDEPDAVILDLDGVVTRTATLHRDAWKETFDALLARAYPDQPPFDAERDYLDHVDGLPRLDGVRAFLASRGLELQEGSPRDTLADGTIRGIGNHKNQRFLQLLKRRGAEVFDDAVRRIERWRDEGVPVAVASSSRNCRAILDSAGLSRLFDVRVDGETLADLKRPGKPAPDLFLEAAEQLGAAAARCAVLEDAISGVEAAQRGAFGLVVGVDREGGQAAALREHGADVVVSSLEGLKLDLHDADEASRGRAVDDPSGGTDAMPTPEDRMQRQQQQQQQQEQEQEQEQEQQARGDDVPLVLQHLDTFAERLDGRTPAVFLDFDGTLSPIVPRPEMAELAEGMHDRLRRLAERFPVIIVSGRDREDVRERVGLDDLVCAGSHGFDIAGPGLQREHQAAEDALPALAEAERELQGVVDEVDGAQLERKRYGIAVHHRNVADADVPALEQAVQAAVRDHPGLRRSSGKKVLEVQPDVDWHKGRAVQWIMDALHLSSDHVVPLYVGDDVTDEDAFAALPARGAGILVADEPRPTRAAWRVRDVDEVARFLDWLAERPAPERRPVPREIAGHRAGAADGPGTSSSSSEDTT